MFNPQVPKPKPVQEKSEPCRMKIKKKKDGTVVEMEVSQSCTKAQLDVLRGKHPDAEINEEKI